MRSILQLLSKENYGTTRNHRGTTSQAGPANTAALQDGINHLIATVDELSEQEAGK
jgi:hypothetical protein